MEINDMKRTSTSYVTTLDVNSSFDMAVLQSIKKAVSVMNYRNPNKKRVVLRGRKPMEKRNLTLSNGTVLRTMRSYDFGGNIVGGIKNATKLDVYIYDRRD